MEGVALLINGIEYTIRHNYLHRPTTRLVLNEKKDGQFISVQFNDRSFNLQDLDEYKLSLSHDGYLISGKTFSEVKIKIIKK